MSVGTNTTSNKSYGYADSVGKFTTKSQVNEHNHFNCCLKTCPELAFSNKATGGYGATGHRCPHEISKHGKSVSFNYVRVALLVFGDKKSFLFDQIVRLNMLRNPKLPCNPYFFRSFSTGTTIYVKFDLLKHASSGIIAPINKKRSK